MTTSEVAERLGVVRSTVLKWCVKNKLKRKLGKNGVMEYDLSEKDIEKFESRPNPGRPKYSRKKTKS